jgi:hypothetical protein
MNNDFEKIKKQWHSQKTETKVDPIDLSVKESIISRKGESLKHHYATIAILSVTLVIISLFFLYFAPVEFTLSRIGALLMVVGLAVRIVIEIISMAKLKRIDMTSNATDATSKAIDFRLVRKLIHGPVTILIVALYTLGFYLITPEFAVYIPTNLIILMCVSYPIGGAILVWAGRNGIKQEMTALNELISKKSALLNHEG